MCEMRRLVRAKILFKENVFERLAFIMGGFVTKAMRLKVNFKDCHEKIMNTHQERSVRHLPLFILQTKYILVSRVYIAQSHRPRAATVALKNIFIPV